ncbi:efflux transporter outer membrane subunit [Lampropedia puyangensis]|uniref:Efflux transporter outer membrane subunit n=1 Tax=Lampropedia puyangensis TaxID=1330072 RepID=A0A4S8EU10_9BURK|nr:efflux transporter outer membrane subunit [Lampropedia puyangensis]THT98252.1 efflux transporter outer membrane subunit [Lampropedia puyangensis]
MSTFSSSSSVATSIARGPSHRARTVCALLCLALLAGCSNLKTPYQPGHSVAVPNQWSASVAGQAGEGERVLPPQSAVVLQEAWWHQFGDDILNQLIEQALARNSDLVAAAWNLRQAQLALGLSQDRQTPSVGASASTNASRNLDGGGSTNRSYSVGLNVSYELDLWGRLSSQSDAAAWRVAASEQDVQSTAVALVASVATLYWQLAYQNEQIANAQQSLAYVRETQKLVQAQYDAGSVSGLELQEARRSIASQEAALAQLRQSHASTRNALAVLLKLPPTDATWPQMLAQEPQALPVADVPDIPAGVPAVVLARRPDVQAAEARLRATLADGDATRASYYPTFSLTAGLGSSSNSLGQWLSNPVGSLGASLALPFLRQTEMRLNNAASKATYEAALNGFEKTLLTALQEVEDALGTRQQLAQQRQWLQQQLDAADKVQALNEVRYRTGATALKAWLDAQEARRSAQLALSANRFNQLSNQLTLYKALGGDAVLPAPDVPAVEALTIASHPA